MEEIVVGLSINNIIILENKERFIVLKEAMYYGKKYFLAMGVDDNNKVISSNMVILEEYVSGFETYVTKIVDNELIGVLTRMFKAQL